MKQLFFSSGTTQVDRTPKELLPAYVSVDERTVSDFLDFIQQFSTVVKYVDTLGNASGNWEVFFENDLSFLLARISQTDLNDFPVKYTDYKEKLANASLPDEIELYLVKLFLLNIELGELLDTWYKQIVYQMGQESSVNKIEALIIELTRSNIWDGALQIETCYKNMWHTFSQNPNRYSDRYLPPLAHQLRLAFEKILGPTSTIPGAGNTKPLALAAQIPFLNYNDFENYLDQLYRSLYATASLIIESIPSFLDESLNQANHAPQISLFLALWEMMKAGKSSLNQFTKKHLNYYYGQVLQQQLAPAVADTVFLYFKLKPKLTQAFLAKGTKLLAGKTLAGEPIEYALNNNLNVNLAQTVAFKTIYNGTISNKITDKNGLIIANPKANALPAKEKKIGWKTFGNSTQAKTAELGFAFASPNLFMSEATRTVIFSFNFTPEQIQSLEKEFLKLGVPQIAFWTCLKSLFQEAYTINYTSAKKWIAPSEVKTELMVTEVDDPTTKDQHIEAKDKTSTKSVTKSITKSDEGDEDKKSDKKSDKGTGKNTAKNTSKNPDKSTDKSTDKKTDKSADKNSNKNVDKATDKTTDKNADKTSDKTPKTTADETQAHEQFGIAYFITISDLQAAVSSYNVKAHGPGYQTEYPLLRFILNQEISISYQDDKGKTKSISLNPYRLLVGIKLKQINLNYHVEGTKSFIVQNDFSKLKIKNPYAPFGTNPIVNSHFYLGNNEIFRKPLIYFFLNINWYDLPNFDKGFYSYYKEYNRFQYGTPFYNSVFKWSADILVEKEWKALLGITDQLSPQDLLKKQKTDLLKVNSKGELSPTWRAKSLEALKAYDKITPKPFYIFEWENELNKTTDTTNSNDKIKLDKEAPRFPREKNEVQKLIDFLENHLKELSTDKPSKTTKKKKKKDSGFLMTIQSVIHILSHFLGIPTKETKALSTEDTTTEKTTKKNKTKTGDKSTVKATPVELPPAWLFEGALKPNSILELIQFDKNREEEMTLPSAFNPELMYTDQVKDGFLRFTLAEPYYGFGQDLYTQVISDVSNYNVNQILNRVAPNSGGTEVGETKKNKESNKEESTWEKWLGDIEGIFAALGKCMHLISDTKQQSQYSDLLEGAKASVLAKTNALQAAASGETKLLPPPKPAYIPKIKNLSASYGAFEKINFGPESHSDESSSSFFHLNAFGIVELTNSGEAITIVPEYKEEGYCYIGIENVQSPEVVSVLFILNESSGKRGTPIPKVNWEYLSNGTWLPLTPSNYKDGTSGFVRTGIIAFDLPESTSEAGDMFANQKNAAELYWLRASVSDYGDAVCNIVEVQTQAATASYIINGNDPSHFDKALPANTITKFAVAENDIAKVTQALPSIGGQAEEDDTQYYTRVSERLRHKDRAINAWDFERLVLQLFPEVGIVRCLSHSSVQAQRMKAGTVSIVILPSSLANCENPLQLKANQSIRQAVKVQLSKIIAPFTQLEIRSPEYELLKVFAKIKLRKGLDPGHYLQILNTDLIALIAPWQENYPSINPFKTNVSYFSIIEFINHQTYVEEVLEMELASINPNDPSKIIFLEKKFEAIQTKFPWMMISSVTEHALVLDNETLDINIPIKPKAKKLSLKTKNLKLTKSKTKDVKIKDVKTKDVKTKDVKTKDVKTKDVKTKDPKTKDAKKKKKKKGKEAFYISIDLYD